MSADLRYTHTQHTYQHLVFSKVDERSYLVQGLAQTFIHTTFMGKHCTPMYYIHAQQGNGCYMSHKPFSLQIHTTLHSTILINKCLTKSDVLGIICNHTCTPSSPSLANPTRSCSLSMNTTCISITCNIL